MQKNGHGYADFLNQAPRAGGGRVAGCLGFAIPVYYLVATAEASSNLARYDGVRYGARTRADLSSSLFERDKISISMSRCGCGEFAR